MLQRFRNQTSNLLTNYTLTINIIWKLNYLICISGASHLTSWALHTSVAGSNCRQAGLNKQIIFCGSFGMVWLTFSLFIRWRQPTEHLSRISYMADRGLGQLFHPEEDTELSNISNTMERYFFQLLLYISIMSLNTQLTFLCL